MADTTGQLVLAQNQYAFIQDATKGSVQVYVGPHALALSSNDKPVVYDNVKDEFTPVNDLRLAIKQFSLVPEGHYIVLENPAYDNSSPTTAPTLFAPKVGKSDTPSLQLGRKVNIAGPTTFPLWPGQFAKAISGHHLRSNQYLVVRVYNGEQATKAANTVGHKDNTPLVNGQLFVIKGTEVPFFIPATGFEVLAESNNSYVREALTLERLEYCILLAESGEKRFERGPKVVFPEATEQFMTKQNSKKFKAIELNDQMGLYIKVIADYEVEDGVTAPEGTVEGGEFTYNGTKYRFEGGKVFAIAGEELFITGKDQRIYYPRAEHGLITYKDPKQGGFDRERYYGIAIPKGEGRYVLVKDKGDVFTQKGPQIFLPDPRNEVIVRRVLDTKTVALWYPGNQEAIDYNENLRELLGESDDNYVADALVRSANVGTDRGFNRNLKSSKALVGAASSALESFEGDKLSRGTQFTPPPSITLNTKYDGVPTVSPYVGYAVQVVDKSGNRRVVVGPDTILLAYDESLAILELSTGKPKTTDNLLRAAYLRVDNNIVSDVVRAETKDLVNVDVKLSYRVNFLRENKDKWFSVENYVKFLCDHMRSRLKGAIKQLGVKEFIENSTAIVRDTVLGVKVDDATPRHFTFTENGMDIYDVEVLGATISDDKIAGLLRLAQQTSVTTAINLSTEEAALEAKKRSTAIQTEVADLEHGLATHKLELASELEKAEAEATMTRLEEEIAQAVAKITAKVNEQTQLEAIAESTLSRRKADEDYTISLEEQRVTFFTKRMEAIAPDLIAAMNTLGNTEFATKLSTAIAPLALHEQMGLGTTLEKIFANTPFATILTNLQSKTAKAGQ
jgi:major vault protein